mmetsp:Transcript_18649/g.48748  ORF Transcript_18649/g.48748 Transcript_18649/m.48748 type:complete len:386 (-) Transcript_18649:134-1291(-)
MATHSRSMGLLVVLVFSAAWSGTHSEVGHGLGGTLHKPGDPATRWQLSWQPGVTTPPRRLVPVRWNYMSKRGGVWSPDASIDSVPDECQLWRQCVHAHNLERTLTLTPWPPGTNVLFLGNSYVNQLDKTAVLDVPDGAIRSMSYPSVETDCLHRTPAKCVLADHLSMSPQDTKSGLHVDGVQYCDNWNYNGTVLAKYGDTAQKRRCVASPGVVKMYDGTILANIINSHKLIDMPLELGVQQTIGMPVSAFDVVVANQGNLLEWYRKIQREGEPDHPGDGRGLPVDRTLSALERGGFRGHLFMVSDRMWWPLDPEVSLSLRKAEAKGLSFSVHASSALDSKKYEVFRTCGRAYAKGGHACMPGPTLWMIEAVRAEYVAYLGTTGEV